MNALIHGNLALDRGYRDDLRALTATGSVIEALFASPAIALSMIRLEARWTRITLNVVVHDGGRGFKLGELPSQDERSAEQRPATDRHEIGERDAENRDRGDCDTGDRDTLDHAAKGQTPAGRITASHITGRGVAIMGLFCDRATFLHGGTAVRLGFMLPRRLRDA